MNVDKFTDALGEIDDRYVTEALSFKRVKRGRKYIFALAAAACLLLAVIAGGKFISGLSTDSDVTPPLPTVFALEPDDSPVNDKSGSGEGVWMYDFEEYDMVSPWTDDMAFDTLPVYRNLLHSTGDVLTGLTEEQMTEKVNAAADALGIESISCVPVTEEYYEGSTKYSITNVTCSADGVTITAYAYGETLVEFADPVKLPSEYKFSTSDTTEEEARKTVDFLCSKYSELLDFNEVQSITWNYCGITGDVDDSGEITNAEPFHQRQYQAVDVTGNDEDRLLNRNFRRASFVPDENGNLQFIRISDRCSNLEKLGDYPLISMQDASDKLLRGEFVVLGSTEKKPVEDMSKVVGVELSYAHGLTEEYALPYYVFWVETGKQRFGLKIYSIYLIPAIEEQYISNISVYNGHTN